MARNGHSGPAMQEELTIGESVLVLQSPPRHGKCGDLDSWPTQSGVYSEKGSGSFSSGCSEGDPHRKKKVEVERCSLEIQELWIS